jgi:hypothetical protein
MRQQAHRHEKSNARTCAHNLAAKAAAAKGRAASTTAASPRAPPEARRRPNSN